VCGIGGILRTDGQPIPEEWLDAIDARIAYRGPDGHGRFRDRVEIDDPNGPGGDGKHVVEVAFVHRRLSIIDHKDGAQPMVSERGRNEKEGLVAVVFNGCIYNHRELRKELEAKGHRFSTDHSDTEVLIHGWREWGDGMIARLEGMYALALWDRTRGWLVLSRDVFGEKPLYIRRSLPRAGAHCIAIAFSSECGSLQSFDAEESTVPHHAAWIEPYLRFGYAPAGATPQRRVRIVAPAETLAESIHQDDCVCPDPQPFGYGFTDNLDGRETPAEHAGWERIMEQAVARRLEADVPVGCFLSGGVDSSLIARFASRHRPDIRTFCVRMPDPRYDESAHARQAAAHLGIQHTTLDAAMQPVEDLQHLIGLLGQPFGDSSILPTYWVSRAAREHVKVALSGDGGDELFFGYERYMAARRLASNPRMLAMLPQALLRRTHPKSLIHKLGRLGEMARDYATLGVECMASVFNVPDIEALSGNRVKPVKDNTLKNIARERRMHRELFDFDFRHADASRGFSDAMRRAKHVAIVQTVLRLNDPAKELQGFDIMQYLPDDLLRKVDTASMACGLEVRCPFLDRDLARAALAAPIEQLMPGGQRKGLLRQIARKYLPKEIVDRPKMGFAIPIGEWFRDDNLPARGAGMKTLLLDHLNSAEPFGPIQLNRRAVQRFIDDHMSGKRDHGQRLFTLLTLSIWARMFARL
jgi:asparagine synthase (glutamine-hydrolysing)